MTPATQTGKCRLGLLLNDRLAGKHVLDFIRWAQAHDRLEIAHVILLPPARRPGLSGFARGLFGFVGAIERLLLTPNARYRDYARPHDVTPTGAAMVDLRGEDDAAGRIKALGLDLLVSFGGEAADLADAARLGVVSVTPEGFSGFWPAYRREDTSGFIIRHVFRAGGASTLLRGHAGTQFYFLLNQAALNHKATHYLRIFVDKIAAGESVPSVTAAAVESAGAPGAHHLLTYLGRLCWRVARKLLRKMLSIDYRWHVGVVRAGWRDAVAWRAPINSIENPPKRYLADPFVVERNGRRVCFVEDFDIAKGRGRISAYEIGPAGASFIGAAVEELCHLSFPYVFEYDGALYMCPETSEARDIRVYKCAEFPLRWTLEKVIMKDVSAVDTMLFERNGRWWMLTNTDPAQLHDFQLELRLFSAASPLDDVWTAHPQNPLMVDASRARNAGLLREDGRLFRVAQRQGFDLYGKATSINEIVQIDEHDYSEVPVCDVSPDFQRGIVGTHHLHSDGAVTVFDFAR